MNRHQFSYTAKELLPYIDWSYFFHAWSISHRNSNSEAALELQRDAINVITKSSCRVNALFGLCDARSEGDNLIIDGTTLPLLRQQHNNSGPNLCLSDFVSPYSDKIGLFATSIESSFEESRDANDPYHNLLIQTIADRLAEAAATLLHLHVRTNPSLWGYAPNEQLTIEELNREQYQGIRPAVGYPSLPDQSIIFIIDKLLNLNDAGIILTESGAMRPHASVCGIMIAHPAARYFAVGEICEEQFSDYAQRRGIEKSILSKYLVKNI